MSRDKEWYELPRPAAMARLVELRDEMRKKNLYDTEEPKLAEQQGAVAEELKAARTVDGSYNDLKCPMMGSTGARFGRNVPLTEVFPDSANLLNPNPRAISNAATDSARSRTATQPAAWVAAFTPRGTRTASARAIASASDAAETLQSTSSRSMNTSPVPSSAAASS